MVCSLPHSRQSWGFVLCYTRQILSARIWRILVYYFSEKLVPGDGLIISSERDITGFSGLHCTPIFLHDACLLCSLLQPPASSLASETPTASRFDICDLSECNNRTSLSGRLPRQIIYAGSGPSMSPKQCEK